jgi:ParB-like chromosome segregation protein Spo0J
MGKRTLKAAPGQESPATTVELWDVAALAPYAGNAREHSPAQITAIAGSIRTFGFTIPLLVGEDGGIIAGHGRLLAAQELGMTQVPVIVAKGWTDEQRRAYGLADNRLAETSTWNLDQLRVEIAALTGDAVDLSVIGFDAAALEALTAGTFAPTVAGLLAPGRVTDEQVAAAQRRIAEHHRNAANQDLIDVMCPHCGESFKIDRPKGQ